MLRLKKLVVHRFRDVVPGTTLEFADGVNAIIGLNGTGKTTLLKLASAMLRYDISDFGEEEYDLETYLARSGAGDPEGFFVWFRLQTVLDPGSPGADDTTADEGQRPRSPRPTLQVKVKDADDTLHLDLHVDADGKVTLASPEKEIGQAILVNPPFLRRAINIALSSARQSGNESLSRILGNLVNMLGLRGPGNGSTTGRIDEGLEAFHALTRGASADPQGAMALQVAIEARNEQPVSFMIPNGGITARLFSGLLGRDNDEMEWPTMTAEQIGAPHLPAAIGAEEVEFRFSPESDETRGDTRTLTYEGCDLWARWSPHSQSKHTTWSFGQKRMAAFCYYAACAPEGVILADELTNGLHHSMVETCFEIIGERQAILATQNPLLLDHMAFESADHMRRSFVLCELKKGPRGERQWIWRNPTEDEAESFFRAYQVDVSHVSEILRSKGLW